MKEPPPPKIIVELGDIVADDGIAGIVIDIADGQPVIRPFPIPEQRDWPGKPQCVVLAGPLKLLKKHFERDDREIERLWSELHPGRPRRALGGKYRARSCPRLYA